MHLKPKRLKVLSGTILITLVAVSCVRDVILDAGDAPQVVVECILSDEPVQTLYLVYTKGASRETAPELPEAVVMLTDLTEGREAGCFSPAADGSWQLAYAAVPGHRYRLDVTVPGHEPIWAEQAMPEALGVEVRWHSWDPVSKDNNVGYTFRLRNTKSPVWFYGIDYPTADSPGEITQLLCTDYPGVDDYNLDKTVSSAGSYTLYNERSLWGGSDFHTTTYPALVGAPFHNHYLRLPANEEDVTDEFYVSGTFKAYISDHKRFMTAEVRPAELHYLCASEDYDRFIRDGCLLREIKSSTDLANIYVRDNVYSNIHGAIGLFGAKMERALKWEGKESWQASGYFLLAGFVSSFDYDESSPYHDYYSGVSHLMSALRNGRPFDLLHYEYVRVRNEREYGEYPDLLPDWSPQLMPGFDPFEDALSRFYLETIQDQEHLDAYGLGDFGEIDFSKKKVLVCVISFLNEIPVLIGFGYPYSNYDNTYGYTNYWPEGKYAPIIATANTPSTPSVENYYSLFRCALLIDRDDQIANHFQYYTSFVYRYLPLSAEQSMAESLAWNYP